MVPDGRPADEEGPDLILVSDECRFERFAKAA